MNKSVKVILSLAICVCMIFSTVPVRAAEESLTISTADEFLAFAESCRLDSYSKGLTVNLAADIDLSGLDFQGIPIFYGTFNGEGHTLSGLNITAEGSTLGLFRYIEENAAVRQLNVSGAVTPQGSRCSVGGIAGSNAGLIEGCSFLGTAVGADTVGGIAGINLVSGTIDGCTANAQVYGDHFVGGVAGKNQGVVRNCRNDGDVNATEKQNNIEISDITLDSLTNAESAITVTDIGGIAGTSTGVIRTCENHGTVGYRHMGYNIGGIAGSQMGYLTDCTNHGSIFGRKDIGGIVGQMEPSTTLQYEEDTLQILQGQLDTLSTLTDRASANASSSASSLDKQLNALDTQVDDAKAAVDQMLPHIKDNDLDLPDPDSILAAQNNLSSSVAQISGSLGSITTQIEDSAETMKTDLYAISRQMDVINNTLDNASESISGSITDISNQDTAEDTTGKVSSSYNEGSVQGDWNVGGITGSIGFENDLDPDSDVSITGELSLNFACDVRAVVLECTNIGSLTVKTQNAGGIAGLMGLGLLRQCENVGSVHGENADYAGGIAGRSNGYIRFCSAKAIVTGSSYTGGIAGMGAVVSECLSMTRLSGTEAIGGILGYAQTLQDITSNYYLAVNSDIGGIDGISYEGIANPLSLEKFLALETLPERFKTNTITFLFPDGTQQVLTVTQGSSPDAAEVPAVPVQDGYVGTWEGQAGETLDSIVFDAVFEAVYTALPVTLQSQTLRESGFPILLVQGSFPLGSVLTLEETTAEGFIEVWQFRLPDGSSMESLRYLLPDGYAAKDVTLQLCDGSGIWRETEYTSDGSYLVFSAKDGDTAIRLSTIPQDYTLLILLIGVLLLAAAAVVTIVLVKHRKKKTREIPADK